jgi:SAM-dependent methyltransferase
MVRAMRTGLLLLSISAMSCATVPASGAAPDASGLIDSSQAFFKLVDGYDLKALEAMLPKEFERREANRSADLDWFLKSLEARKERGFPQVSERKWTELKLRQRGPTAVVTGFSEVKLLPAEGKPLVKVERHFTLVWAAEGGSWKLIHLEGEDSGIEAERARWNEAFRSGTGFNLQPNKFLMEVAKTRKPGLALDMGVGQGRNALFLASQGWKVTGVDISDEGVRIAQEAAKTAGLTLETVVQDADAWDWGTDKWDLVCLIYMGGQEWVGKVRQSLKKGGVVVLEYFMASDVASLGIGGFKPGELPELFKDGFKVLRYEEVEDVADYSLRKLKLVRFVAEKT